MIEPLAAGKDATRFFRGVRNGGNIFPFSNFSRWKVGARRRKQRGQNIARPYLLK